ncbi:MAG: adenosine deaminase [Hyphomicrobiales bacterium]|nr:adenosine deaminase [Hyphomicrobiales bacterium]
MTDDPEAKAAWNALRALPKAEVHVHLEGCFAPETLEQWALEAGVPMPRPRSRLFEFEGLADFLHFLDWACGLANSEERLARLAFDFCRRLEADGTGYADVIVNPTHWSAWRGRTKTMLEALDDGFRRAEEAGLPPVGLCVSLLRTQSADEALALVEDLSAWRLPRVVALSVDGNEAAAGRTGPRFAAAFRKAGEAGLGRTVHAGESSGPEGVRDAIELLGADRVDHGVRAIEDERVVALLAERGVPLGVCPTSNLTLKVYSSMDEHPLDRLRRAGVRVSVNTDDPALLSTNLPREYGIARQAYRWSDDLVRDAARTSIEASFAGLETKKTLLSRLDIWRSG